MPTEDYQPIAYLRQKAKNAGEVDAFDAVFARTKAELAVGGKPASKQKVLVAMNKTRWADKPGDVTAVLNARRAVGLRALLERVSLPNRKVSRRELFEWVGEHLQSSVEEIEASEIPRKVAITMLIEAIERPDGIKEFLVAYRNATQGESASETLKRFEDDGRVQDEFWSKVAAIFASEKPAT